MWLSKLLQKHFQGHSSSTPGKTRHGTAPSWRRLRLEPLEQRTLLSVAMRVTFWTEDRIDDLGTFVEGQDWPESLGVVDPEFVEELVHIPLWSDPRAGYKTIVRMPVFGDITADEAAATLEQLNFVEHARLESECVVQYGPRSQELIDAITIDHGGGSGHICGDEAPGQAHAIDMRVSLWTQRLIPDVGALVEAQTWPEALGGLDRYQVEELVHIPLWSDPRGGYKTIVRMTVFGDISALEQVDFLDYAKLEAESPFRYTARSQELVDALTWGNSSAAMKPATGGGGATAVRPAEIRDLQADPVDLGVVDFLELTDQASYSGELWYRLEARRPAILTVERGPVPFGAETTLTLYEVDASGNLRQLATDPERIDYADTVQGNEYLVHVSNVRSPVDLRLANLVVTDYIRPGKVKVRHPTGQYRFEFTAGKSGESPSDPGVPHRVSINGLVYEFDPDQFDDIGFSGDHAVVFGSDAAETLTVWLHYQPTFGWGRGPESVLAKLHGPWGEFTVSGDWVRVDGGGGADVAELHAGVDSAHLGASPHLVTLMGERTSCTATGFESVTADGDRGTAPVVATADLWDSAGNDRLVARPGEVMLSGASGFSIQVTRYHSVNVRSELGGIDMAQIYDSAGNDVFVAVPQKSVMEYADGSTVVAEGFDYAHAYATEGGFDVAKLYCSTGDDTFYAVPTWGAVYDDPQSFYNRAKFFEQVHAYANNLEGGFDVAKLYDSDGNDVFDANPIHGVLSGTGFYNRAKFFDQVHAYATAGGNDVANLAGSTGDDTFRSEPLWSALWGTGFYNRAKFFEKVHVDLSQDGDDQGDVYDSSGDDLLKANDDWADLSTGAVAWFYISGFDDLNDKLTAHSTDGEDHAQIQWLDLLFDLDLDGDWIED